VWAGRWHWSSTTTMDERERYTAIFSFESNRAQQEVFRLRELLTDVLWYNFETECRKWKHPWRQSSPESELHLMAPSYELVNRNGVLVESGTYNVYFQGMVWEAPPLPVQIVTRELKAAEAYMRACKEQERAAYDWAPGGPKYEVLRSTNFLTRYQCKDGRGL